MIARRGRIRERLTACSVLYLLARSRSFPITDSRSFAASSALANASSLSCRTRGDKKPRIFRMSQQTRPWVRVSTVDICAHLCRPDRAQPIIRRRRHRCQSLRLSDDLETPVDAVQVCVISTRLAAHVNRAQLTKNGRRPTTAFGNVSQSFDLRRLAPWHGVPPLRHGRSYIKHDILCSTGGDEACKANKVCKEESEHIK